MEAHVEAYCGLMGAGKSCACVARIVEYLAVGGVVYTNIELALDPHYDERYKCQHLGTKKYLLSRYGWELQDGQYVKLDRENLVDLMSHIPRGTVERPVLVVLDEALDEFDSLDRGDAQKRLRDFLSFIRHCRKYCVDLIFIAQEFSQLNNRIRTVCSSIYICRDMAKTSIPGLGLKVPFPWNQYFVVQQMDKSCKIPYRRQWLAKDKGLFGCYKTSELFRTFNMINAKTDFRGLGRKKKKGIAMFWKVACVCSLVLSCVVGYRSFFVGEDPEQKKVDIAVVKIDDETGIEFDRFGIMQLPNQPMIVIASGVKYWKGRLTRRGLVIGCTRDNVLLQSRDGKELLLCNGEPVRMSPQDRQYIIDRFWAKNYGSPEEKDNDDDAVFAGI